MAAIRVLYAEDNPVDADLTSERLRSSGPTFELVVVASGRACLDAVANGAFDVLLLDNHLPDMDGVDVLAALAELRRALPVVIVTGVGDDAVVVQALRAGASDYVPKAGDYLERLPVVLQRVVDEWRERLRIGAPVVRGEHRILYVEPNAPDVQLTLEHSRRAAPHLHWTVRPTPAEARELLKAGERFDLIVTDLRTPGMSALEFIHEVKLLGLAVPVVVVTGRGDEATAVAALHLGALDYIVKRHGYFPNLTYAIDNAIQRHALSQVSVRQHEELVRARERAESADRLKSQFLAAMSHELRTPLNSIIGFSDILRSGSVGPVTPEQRTQLEFVYAAGLHLRSLASDLLDLSRIEAGQLLLASEPFDLAQVIDEAILGQRPFADPRGLRLVAAPETRPLPLIGDRTRVLQVLINLVGNAVKFTERGEVCVAARRDGGRVTLTVRDTGIGIAVEQQGLLFEPFRRIPGSARPGDEGVGLGLYLVRKLLAHMGGEITVASELGNGSVFTVSFPSELAAGDAGI